MKEDRLVYMVRKVEEYEMSKIRVEGQALDKSFIEFTMSRGIKHPRIGSIVLVNWEE